MNLKKLKSFYPIIANQLNLPVDVVESFYENLFAYTKIKLHDLKDYEVFIKNLGSFRLRLKRTSHKAPGMTVMVHKNILLAVEADTDERIDLYSKKSRDKFTEQSRLLKLYEILKEQYSNKLKKVKIRDAYIAGNLEKQGDDNGGYTEQRDKERARGGGVPEQARGM